MVPFLSIIDYHILLWRLEHLSGIKITPLGWFKSYVSDKYKFVQIKNESSLPAKVHVMGFHKVMCSVQIFLLYVCFL